MAKIIPFSRQYAYKDDAQMVADVIAGDNLATRFVFYENFNGILHGCYNRVVATRNLPVEYDDIVQELYLHLRKNDWGKLRQFTSSKGLFPQWFTSVTFNFFADYCKKTYYQVSELNGDSRIYDTMVAPFDWGNSDLVRDIERVLPGFEPPSDRELVEIQIKYGDDRKALRKKKEELARRDNITVDSVSRNMRKAMGCFLAEYFKELHKIYKEKSENKNKKI